jgi:hypothetical protein
MAIATRKDCPHCGAKDLRKRGIDTLVSGKQVQKYTCLGCGRYFNARTGTIKSGRPTGRPKKRSRHADANKIRIGLRLPAELLEQVDAIAAADDISRTALIKGCLTEFVKQRPQRDRDES